MQPAPKLTVLPKPDTRARLTAWVCISCGHRWPKDAPARYCRACGLRGGYAPEEIELSGKHSDAVDDLEPGTIVAEWQHLLPIGIPLGLSLVLRGRPGGGKSRAGFRLASQLGRAAIFALEMGEILSKETARSAGANLGNCWWYEEVPGLKELRALDPDVVVVDSIQMLRRRKTTCRQLRNWAREHGRNAIFVSQLGLHGSSRHGEDDDFAADLVVDVSPGQMDGVPCKNRHGNNSKPDDCREGCAHLRIAKSRVCQLLGGDVPIVAGY